MGYRFLSVEKGVLKINKGMCGSCASQCVVFGKSVKVDEELLTSNLGILGINLVVSLIYGVPILFLIFLSLIDHFLFVVDPLIAFFFGRDVSANSAVCHGEICQQRLGR